MKLLMVNESSHLSTGYSVYGNDLLSRLSNKYEVGELACYLDEPTAQTLNRPWKVFPNVPNKEHMRQYESNIYNTFGKWRFEEVCLKYKPSHCMAIRDFWMDSFMCNSPFRRFYSMCWMPTVDARSQNEEWLYTYSNCDAILSYTDWNGKVLKEESNNQINWVGAAIPIPHSVFKPLSNRNQFKKLLGLSESDKIIGTVMRNQKRKLFPDLFLSFRKYIDKYRDKNTYLYCHTSFPDNGWDIPALINEYNLSSRVFLTYVCNKCNDVTCRTFQDAVTDCKKCGNFSCTTSNVVKGVNNQILSQIYNLFDVYVQYANSEGCGIPLIEAAACGTPIMSINYSAVEDTLEKIEGTPINVLAFSKELETGCMRAIPDNDDFVEKLYGILSLPQALLEQKRWRTRQLYEENYSWDNTIATWEKAFNSTSPKESWDSPAAIKHPAAMNENHNHLNNYEFAKWLITDVLYEPERLNTYFHIKMVRDLNYRHKLRAVQGLYHNDESWLFGKPQYVPYSKEEAYKECLEQVEFYNYCEQLRTSS